jgi:hypothetical protein
MADLNSIRKGWYRYWDAFIQPWPEIVGFILASVCSTVFYECVKAVAWGMK